MDAVATWQDGTSGWHATGERDAKVGYWLRDVMHDGHYLATSIRVERVAVAGFTDTDPFRRRDQLASFHVLGSATARRSQHRRSRAS